jgi:hypothetical protein
MACISFELHAQRMSIRQQSKYFSMSEPSVKASARSFSVLC